MENILHMLKHKKVDKTSKTFPWIQANSDIFLQNMGICLTETDSELNSIFHLASELESSWPLKCIISKCPNLDEEDCRGLTPLHKACLNGLTKNARILLENGAGVNVQTRRGNTPLMLAAKHGDLKLIKMLVSFNANIELVNLEGEKALDLARNRKKPDEEMVKLLHPLFRQL